MGERNTKPEMGESGSFGGGRAGAAGVGDLLCP